MKTHVSHVLGKLNVESREEAAAYWSHYNSPGGRMTRYWNAIVGVVTSKAMAAAAATLAIAGAAVFVAVFLAGRSDEPPSEANAGEPRCTDLRDTFLGSELSARICEPGDDSDNLTPLILLYDCRDPLHSWDFEREAARAGYVVIVPELYSAAQRSSCGTLSGSELEAELTALGDKVEQTYLYVGQHGRVGAPAAVVTRGGGAGALLAADLSGRASVLVHFSAPYPEEVARGFRLQAGHRSSRLVLAAGHGPWPAERSKALVDDVRAAGGHAEYLYYPNADGLWREEDAPGAWEAALEFLDRELRAVRFDPASPPRSNLAIPAGAADVDCSERTFFASRFEWVPARVCQPADGSADPPGLLVMFGCDEVPDPWDFELEAARAGFSVLVVDAHLDFAPPAGGCDATTLYEWGWRIPYVVYGGLSPFYSTPIPVNQAVIARGQGATTVFDEERPRGPVVLLTPEYRKGEVNPLFTNGYTILNTSRPTLVIVHGSASPERVAQAELVVADILAGGDTATLELFPGADAEWTNAASMAALQRALDFLKTGELPN